MLIPKPNSITPPDSVEPNKLFIYGHTKIGKTTLTEALPNHLLIDLENGSNYITGTKLNIRKISKKENMSVMAVLEQIIEEIKAANAAKKGYIYDFGVIDTVTALEDVAAQRALEIYKSLPIGSSFKEDNILLLPKGAGYNYIRIAFEEIFKKFDGLFGKSLIMFGHVKNSSITKEGKELSVRDINLMGKLKSIACAETDVIGYMYRKEGGRENILSFITSEDDIASGARSPYLRNKEVTISRMLEDESIEVYWHEVFPSLKNKK